ncbi:hypothetical protein BGZ60DRAFT_522266 [Tricladium varicosporioides]|nr:hypothetical protein BGZ60DRAFT_522266 [Hymenoscyphus varicosporioides]
MANRILHVIVLITSIVVVSVAQSATASGYIGYNLSVSGDPNSAVYDTASTSANVSTTVPEPDVFLNASVHVGEISLEVTNITAKINLDAHVLSLLSFNAGVDASIDRVRLLIQEVNAHVILEARLSNLVLMIGDVLNSLDLNPILATLGQDVGQIINTTVGGLTGTTSSGFSTASSIVEKRSYDLEHNILYSINDYSGNTHTNRILAQNGSLIDEFLDNRGVVHSDQVVGYYLQDMTFNGYNQSVSKGIATRELEYVYEPYIGLSAVCAVFTDAAGNVVSTQVLSESSAGGTSTVGSN